MIDVTFSFNYSLILWGVYAKIVNTKIKIDIYKKGPKARSLTLFGKTIIVPCSTRVVFLMFRIQIMIQDMSKLDLKKMKVVD